MSVAATHNRNLLQNDTNFLSMNSWSKSFCIVDKTVSYLGITLALTGKKISFKLIFTNTYFTLLPQSFSQCDPKTLYRDLEVTCCLCHVNGHSCYYYYYNPGKPVQNRSQLGQISRKIHMPWIIGKSSAEIQCKWKKILYTAKLMDRPLDLT